MLNLRSRFGIFVTVGTIFMLGIAVFWAQREGLMVQRLPNLVFAIGILGLAYLIVQNRIGGQRAANLIAAATFMMLLGSAGTVMSYIAFRSGAPLADPRLAAWDAMLGFSWVAWAQWVSAYPALVNLFHFAYDSLQVQTTAAVLLLPLCGMPSRCDEFLMVLGLALIPTVILCALFPAEGAGVYFGWLRTAHYLKVQDALRSISVLRYQINKMQGIVTFPSFHAISAVALINAVRRTPFMIIMSILNILMILSALTEGLHYLVDVITGIVISLSCIVLARYLLRTFVTA